MKNHLENKGACGVALQFCNSVLNSRAERVFDISSHFKNHKGAKNSFEVAVQTQNICSLMKHFAPSSSKVNPKRRQLSMTFPRVFRFLSSET